MKYQLICMSFDGEYQTERPLFDTIQDAWEYSNDLGSKWYFYPFHFVTNGKKTIIDGGYPLEELLSGKRVKTVAEVFKRNSERKDMEGLGSEEFIWNMEF